MALKSTIFKCELQISDMNRAYYATHSLTVARHPSETDERMMVRLLAFALNASESLVLTKGLSTDDEPSLWQKSLTDEIELWIDLGQIDEKRIRKASGRARQVIIYTYNQRSAEVWWPQIKSKLDRFDNVSVVHICNDLSQDLARLAQRSMQLQCTIQDDQVFIGNDSQSIQLQLESRRNSAEENH